MCLAGRLCLDPLGEITALLRTPWLDFRGSDREREGKKETEEGRERGKEGEGTSPNKKAGYGPEISILTYLLIYPTWNKQKERSRNILQVPESESEPVVAAAGPQMRTVVSSEALAIMPGSFGFQWTQLTVRV